MAKNLVVIFLCALAVSIVAGALIIPMLRRMKAGQNILCYLEEHFCKSGTPTMGGLFFVLASVTIYFMFSRGARSISILAVSVFLCYFIVGFLDDFIKIKFQRNEGLSPMQKILFQVAIAIIAALFAKKMYLTKVYIPFSANLVDLGIWAVPLYVFVFLATTNCVNLTDGLDGLAGSVSFYAFLSSAVLIILQISVMNFYVQSSEFYNLAVLAISTCGALSGFLLFNTYRASVFMGDTGSLALGGLFASIMIFSGNTLFIPIIGIMFVLSGISVIVQVVSFKLTKKRVFLMAPLHHHFQHKGYAESKIGNAYGLITLVCGALSILTFM